MGLFTCLPSLLRLQMSAWSVSAPTANAAAQQISSLTSLITAAPDELSTAARQDAVSHCVSLLGAVDAKDAASLRKALDMMGAVLKQATGEAVVAAGATGGGPGRRLMQMSGWRRFLGGDDAASAAAALQQQTTDGIHNMVSNILGGTQAGQKPQTISVRVPARSLHPFVRYVVPADHRAASCA